MCLMLLAIRLPEQDQTINLTSRKFRTILQMLISFHPMTVGVDNGDNVVVVKNGVQHVNVEISDFTLLDAVLSGDFKHVKMANTTGLPWVTYGVQLSDNGEMEGVHQVGGRSNVYLFNENGTPKKTAVNIEAINKSIGMTAAFTIKGIDNQWNTMLYKLNKMEFSNGGDEILNDKSPVQNIFELGNNRIEDQRGGFGLITNNPTINAKGEVNLDVLSTVSSGRQRNTAQCNDG